MAIETLDDIIEELASQLGVYGAHGSFCESAGFTCRCCWTAELRARLTAAFEVEQKLRGQVLEVSSER